MATTGSAVKRMPTLKKKPTYAGVAEITGKSPGRETWSDQDLIGQTSLGLKVLTDDEMLHEVKVFLHGLEHRMSPRAVASALMLTWNMRSTNPIEGRIFPDVDPGADISDKTLADFEEAETVYVGGPSQTLVDGANGFEARRAGAFLAASTLKMFAKDASGWTLAWEQEHFKKRYEGFMKKSFPFAELVPLKPEVEGMYEAYQGQKIFLGTLGRILYSIADVADTRQTEMLFEQHLSCTGMHIVPQFINAKISIGATTEDLLSALDMKQNEPTLKQLKDLCNNSLSKQLGPDNRGTWRFARLFDQAAFSLLQTKYAQDTVAVLAHINDLSKSANKLSNPLNIAVLRQMGPQRMGQAKCVAKNIYHYFTVTARATENEFYDIDTFSWEDNTQTEIVTES
ncbi:MAG: coat protein [Xinjiang varicosavirus]|uniref:Nucleoprotein n=1 Tax=Xinjiang varicosavirus TaxID=3071319 RepID=A0AAJ4TXK7_9RHAB|nr:MAG: coat protein [Xinjiang varicosa-like virus]QYF49870.1 MAG: coat protein [Xinjiang varicosa-like virus]